MLLLLDSAENKNPAVAETADRTALKCFGVGNVKAPSECRWLKIVPSRS